MFPLMFWEHYIGEARRCLFRLFRVLPKTKDLTEGVKNEIISGCESEYLSAEPNQRRRRLGEHSRSRFLRYSARTLPSPNILIKLLPKFAAFSMTSVGRLSPSARFSNCLASPIKDNSYSHDGFSRACATLPRHSARVLKGMPMNTKRNTKSC